MIENVAAYEIEEGEEKLKSMLLGQLRRQEGLDLLQI
jgi:hypothetical protein